MVLIPILSILSLSCNTTELLNMNSASLDAIIALINIPVHDDCALRTQKVQSEYSRDKFSIAKVRITMITLMREE